jgi:hypothetical protein
MRIIAFLAEAVTARASLAHLGEPTVPPRVAPARGPPRWEAVDTAPTGNAPPRDSLTQPDPAYAFDRRKSRPASARERHRPFGMVLAVGWGLRQANRQQLFLQPIHHSRRIASTFAERGPQRGS